MLDRMTGAGRPRTVPLGILPVIVTVALVACGGNGPTSPAAGECHVTCSDFSTSSYVAIAVSPSSLTCGSAKNQPTASEAQKRAVAACGRPDCVPAVWGRDGVASLAVDQAGYGWGWAPDASSTADAKAIASCQTRTR